MLNVESGGQVISTRSFLGYLSANSSGMATVTGAGSEWIITRDLFIGHAGNGTLTIEAGGRVNSSLDYDSYVGNGAGSSGMATVTGAGSEWIITRDLFIGQARQWHAHHRGGGQVNSSKGSTNYVGNLAGSTGVARVIGAGSEWINIGSLYVGYRGNGTLTIEAGGQASNATGYLGDRRDSTGTATVTGASSQWINAGFLFVGDEGNGTLNIEEGGLVSVGRSLSIGNSSDFINMATGGMLALVGEADDSLTHFLTLVQGNDDALRFWNESLADWAPLTSAIFGVDYTLEYLTSGDFAGYTLLTVGEASQVPEPAGFVYLVLVIGIVIRQRS